MKKILIWNDFFLEPVGGPSGYLYNLKQYIDKYNLDNIDFLNNSEVRLETKKLKNKKFKKLRQVIKIVKGKFFRTRKLKKHIEKLYKPYTGEYSFIKNYDIIHFHSTKDLNRAKYILKDFQGKILLTSHCPKTPAEEEIEDNRKMEYKSFPKKLRKKLENYDKNAFEIADYLVFPCKEAQEPYEENINLKNILNEKFIKNKILYLPTGIPLKLINKDDKFFFNKNIKTSNKFIISYIGRHNKVKGYSMLKLFGYEILKRYDDVIFVIGGEINKDIPPIKHNNWIEFGWTKEGYEIIKNSDLFILPNQKTYFDLILLEVLSMGTPILLTNTGGNRYFKKYEDNGLFYFDKDKLDEMIKKFDKIYKLWKDKKLIEYGQKNSEIFNKDFTIDNFGKNYLSICNEVK